MKRITPIAIFLIVLIAAGGSFVYFLEVPGGASTQVSASYNSTALIVLYANAQGWNYNSSHPNPTIYEKTHVLLEFKVIEQDNLPHTLTINPGPNESASSAIISVDIPAVTGTVVWANWSFSNSGVYTYWCEVHPETMVGLLIINSSQNSSVSANNSSADAPSAAGINCNCTFPISLEEQMLNGIHEEI
jgi:hypothetical protein